METQWEANKLERIEELENRLAEAEQLIEAIKAGEVDAFALRSENKTEVFTLQSGDYAYRVLVENFSEGAINVSEEGLIVYSNKYFHELLGLSYEKVIGASLNDFIHSESITTFNSLFAKALAGQSKGEINLIGANKIIPVYISLTSLYPQLPTVGVIVSDLTEKKKNEKELSDAKNFINNVLSSTNHGVLSYLAIRENNKIIDFEVRYANAIALEQLRLSEEQVIGRRYLTIMPLAKEHGLFDRAVRVAETGKIETYEVKSPDIERWFIVHYVALDDGVTCTFVEITDQKNQAKILEDKNKELERSNVELASFSYSASHDLQEPLRKIRTFTGRILEQERHNLAENSIYYFSRISNAAARMQNLIDALLSYSRTNSSEKIFIPTDLNKVLEETKENLQEMIDQNKATIESGELPTVHIIPLQFQQLLTNILSNAIKYKKENENPVIKINAIKVSVSEIQEDVSSSADWFWKISIVDNGIGFEPQYATKIFQLFQRLHQRNEYSGTGIGLAICKKIIQNHKGTIVAESQLGLGANFHIYLPLIS
ncbi:MAG: ATP-binding protein [Saprospiraceae bacterium]